MCAAIIHECLFLSLYRWRCFSSFMFLFVIHQIKKLKKWGWIHFADFFFKPSIMHCKHFDLLNLMKFEDMHPSTHELLQNIAFHLFKVDNFSNTGLRIRRGKPPRNFNSLQTFSLLYYSTGILWPENANELNNSETIKYLKLQLVKRIYSIREFITQTSKNILRNFVL